MEFYKHKEFILVFFLFKEKLKSKQKTIKITFFVFFTPHLLTKKKFFLFKNKEHQEQLVYICVF